MKIFIFVGFAALFAVTCGVFVPPRPAYKKNHLLGAKECTWGPSYWCQNITTSASCHATKHCIDTVWMHKQLPPDDSEICQTCKDMVKQARDQLLSNETQLDIKAVFEGSCALIHIKPVVKECDKLVDEFVPELIDTLASQMNPQVVCSVAGLCNNERIKRMYDEYEASDDTEVSRNTCDDCHTVANLMENKFQHMTRDDVLQGFLHVCGRLGSLSDACSNIVISYFNEIYQHILDNFNAEDVCLLAGECSAQFHTHANVEITPMSKVGYVMPQAGDDLPCDLCEQLVGHLRDLLTANTTEAEFKMVLQGLCKQTKSFANECTSIVDEYYDVIYQFLTQELQPKEICCLINICPKNKTDYAPMSPLVPIETANKEMEPLPEKPLVHIKLGGGDTIAKPLDIMPENAQLPIELLMPPHTQSIYNKEVCVFCQYFLHYIQNEITDPKNEEEVKQVIDKACKKLPSSINDTCVNFVNMYEPAMIAILAQEIDPSQICPLIKACPANNGQDVEVFMQQPNDNPNCPLCLYAVSKLEDMVKDKKTENSIRNGLSKLCSHLPNDLSKECLDFVKTYTDELVELLMADLNPKEVCVYLKLCKDSTPVKQDQPEFPIIDIEAGFGGDIKTNIIPDDTINGQSLDSNNKPQCVLCEFIMKEIEDQLQNNKTDEEIKNAVRNVCKIMPKSVKKECNDFIDQNADTIINLLIQALEPSQICAMIQLCESQVVNIMKGEILECAICEGIVEAMKKILSNPKTDHSIEHVLEKSCRALPKKFREKCNDIIEKNGDQIIEMINQNLVHPSQICHEANYCSDAFYKPLGFFCKKIIQKHGPEIFNDIIHKVSKKQICRKIELCANDILTDNICSLGSEYYCHNPTIAQRCQAMDFCSKHVWVNRKRRSAEVEALGKEKCTWGPSYWCQNREIAESCGAVKHCETKVWSRQKRSAQVQAVGKEKCTWGPSYWCQSREVAESCGAVKHCESKVWNKQKRSADVQAVGAEKCTWGPSYWCQSREIAESCNAVQHCESKVWNKQKRSADVQAVGVEKCTWGPSYWCQSREIAESCNAVQHCESKVWNKQKRSAEVQAVGAEKCTWGPSYWCQSREIAESCNAVQHCESKVWNKQKRSAQVQAVGAEKCTWGPSYWCQSREIAESCNAVQHCESKVWNKQKRSADVQAVGAEKCTWGPSYWCQSREIAESCNAVQHCESKVWNKQKRSAQGKLVGAEKCTWGPSYWCQSREIAESCNAVQHCESKVWNKQKRSADVQAVGAEKCTWGPSYWCQSREIAESCNAVQHCESKVWNKQKRSAQGKLVGAEKCTWGPSYWCQSREIAESCNAVQHCETKVWNKQKRSAEE